jgi:hypothetical protein
MNDYFCFSDSRLLGLSVASFNDELVVPGITLWRIKAANPLGSRSGAIA